MEHLEGARVVAIDRIAHRVILSDGTALGYKKLALCTGGRPRPLVCKGMDPAQPRVLARVAGPEVSQFYEDVHLDPGVNLITGTIVARMGCEGGDCRLTWWSRALACWRTLSLLATRPWT